MAASLIVVKARTYQESIEIIESRLNGDEYEEKPTDTWLKWAKTTIRTEDIEDIVEYDREKCMVNLWNGKSYFVNEPHAVVTKKWADVKQFEPEAERSDSYQEEDDSND